MSLFPLEIHFPRYLTYTLAILKTFCTPVFANFSTEETMLRAHPIDRLEKRQSSGARGKFKGI